MNSSDAIRTYNVTRLPNVPAVYSVLVDVNGVTWPKTSNHPEVFAYWDGVDCWSYWEFSIEGARLARMCKPSVRYPWKTVEVPEELV